MQGKLNMEVVLNATLAGGVSIGSSSDLVVTPGIALLIGVVAGGLSAIGFLKIGPFLREKCGLYDTCGVHNLHGMPGVLGALIGAFSAGYANIVFPEGSPELLNTFSALSDNKRTIVM
jgi:ammonium transporter Rh